MQNSEKRRALIVQRLLNLKLSTKRELEDIVRLVAVICKTPVVLITLLDNETQHIQIKIGTLINSMPIAESFCQYTILQDKILEVKDTLDDNRFKESKLVTSPPYIRYYAGVPLRTQSGESLGSLCVLDTKPNLLNEDQHQMLVILARQVTTILEFELSLQVLKEEVLKLQESELKLKSIFESSPTAFILLDKNMKVLAFNKAAKQLVFSQSSKYISEGDVYTSLISESSLLSFTENFRMALTGKHTLFRQSFTDQDLGIFWWEIKLNPAYNAANEIIGVSVDGSDISEQLRYKKAIVDQNFALRKIAQVQSHEIRHPVVNMMSLIDIVESSTNAEEKNTALSLLKTELTKLDDKIKSIVQLTT